jgi:dipeptidase D
LYQKTYGDKPQVEAIHAGLECGVFAKGIGDLDCISIGPCLTDIHTPRERANIPSVDKIYQLVENVLTNCKE